MSHPFLGWLFWFGILFLAALVLSLPFGVWRVRTSHFSPAWFLAIHLPVPLIFLLRWQMQLPAIYMLASLAGTVAGQVLGGRIFRPESPSKTSPGR